jgi:hypothetical protein
MRTPLVVGCLLVASLVDAADLMIRQRSSGTMGGPTPTEETVYIAGDKIVTDSPTMRTIVDLQQETITSADKAKKAYSVTTFAELRAQMDMIRSSLESLPPEQRKQMGALFDDSEAVTIKATGKTDTIAGYPAKEHSVRGGPYTGAVWTTDAVAKPAAFAKWKGIEQTRGGAARRLGEAMDRLEGFPLRTRIEMKAGPQAVTLSNEVLELKDASPPKEMLAVPAGFTKQAGRLPGAPAPQ